MIRFITTALLFSFGMNFVTPLLCNVAVADTMQTAQTTVTAKQQTRLSVLRERFSKFKKKHKEFLVSLIFCNAVNEIVLISPEINSTKKHIVSILLFNLIFIALNPPSCKAFIKMFR